MLPNIAPHLPRQTASTSKTPSFTAAASTLLRLSVSKMASHCHDEHNHSGHDHSHAGHDHSDDITPALQYSLYQHVNFDNITTLNEAQPGSGKAIVKKTWAERLEAEPELESDADEQILIHIPFVSPI